MYKFLRDGLIFSAGIILLFLIITVGLAIFSGLFTFDHWVYGFPLTFYEASGPCPPQAHGNCTTNTPINLYLNVGIAIALGFGISYAKNIWKKSAS